MKLLKSQFDSSCGPCVLAIILCIFYRGTKGTMNNVAKFKLPFRAGFGAGGTAIDDDRLTCMRNNTYSDPHWIVDLGDVISSVSIDNQIYDIFDGQSEKTDDLYKFIPDNPMPGRWVKLSKNEPGDLSFCEVEVMTDRFYNRNFIKMTSVDGMEGTGPVLKTSHSRNALHCAALCLYNQMCFGVNVILTSSLETECELLGSDAHALPMSISAKTFWKLSY